MLRTQDSWPYRLAFIDLDDTLLGPDKDISLENLRALDRLREAGVEIAIASGRHRHSIAALPKLGKLEWVLSSHGSAVWHHPTGELLAEVCLPPEIVESLSERGHALDLGVIAYHGEGVYLERITEGTRFYTKQSSRTPKQLHFGDLGWTGFQKLIWSGAPAHIAELAPQLQAEWEGRVNVLITNPELLEFFPQTINKAVGAQTLANRLAIGTEATLAFGDGSNDVELLQWAGLSVAMDHGHETARRAARFVSPPGPRETAFSRAVDLAFSVAG